MDPFFENAQRIFDVARAGDATESSDFAVLIRPDGGLHLVMDSPLSLEAVAIHAGARTAYRVQRSPAGVTVTGRSATHDCRLTTRSACAARASLLRDQPLYEVARPLLAAA